MTAAASLLAPERRVVPAKEYGDVPVTAADVLSPSGQLLIEPDSLRQYLTVDFGRDGLRVKARGVSGLIPLTDSITVQVTPRFPLANLTHMVVTCGYSPVRLAGLRPYDRHTEIGDWLWDVYAEGLLTEIAAIEQQGLLRTYVRRHDASSSPRGRIDINATMMRRASRNIDHIADFTWFERTIDTPVNRCIKEAVVRLHRHYGSPARAQTRRAGDRQRIARLSEALRLLADVPGDPHGLTLADPFVSGLRPLPDSRAYYREGLDLAVAIVSEQGIDLDAPLRDRRAGDRAVALSSLVVKTEDLFEEFVRLGLQRAFAADPDIDVLDGNKAAAQLPLYEPLPAEEELPGGAQRLASANAVTKPDLLLRDNTGRVALVGDVKYTNVSEHAGRSEVEQVILYGARYRSPVVLTVHPRQHGAAGGLFASGRIGDSLVLQYRLDLAAEDLDGEVDRMADALRPFLAATPQE